MGSHSHQPSEQDALQALRLGQHRVALTIYQDLLNREIGDQVSIHLQISMIQGLLGNAEAQNHHVLLAAEIAPSDPRVVLDYGCHLFRLNQLAEARHFFEQVSGESILESKAHGNLAAIEIKVGNSSTAKRHLAKALQLDPNNIHALELSLKLLGEQIKDSALIDQFLNDHKDSILSLLFMLIGRQFDKDGQLSTALRWNEKAIEADPANVSAQLERATILSRIGRSDEAIEQLLVSLAIEPDHIELMLKMGFCLQQINQLDSATYFYQRVLEIETIHTEASNLLGCCYRISGQEEESIPIFLGALEHAPENTSLLGNLASALCNVGRIEESLAISKRILELSTLSTEGFYSYMFTQSTMPRSATAEMIKAAKQYWQAYRESLIKKNEAWTKLGCNQSPSSNDCTKQSFASETPQIKVGILSAEIGAHVVGMFLRSFLLNYDKSNFHVTLIIAHRRYEEQENALVALANAVLNLRGLDTLAAAQAISDKNFDVIIETSGYTNNTQINLLSFRLAPVQCHYIGYHATTGLDAIDYLIGDAIVTPSSLADAFTEKLWRLPETWLAISYDEQLPSASSLAQVDCFTFGSFNQGAKFNQQTFDYWAGALKEVPESILVIKDKSLNGDRRKQWISASLETLGISPSRLRFLGASQSWRDHMSIYNIVDACLDCTRWSGSTTVFDCLSMGTPYIAIKGDTMSSRMSSSILTGYGCTEWIAGSTIEFARIACSLANQLSIVRKGKQDLQARVLALSNIKAKRTTLQLQEALKQMLAAVNVEQ